MVNSVQSEKKKTNPNNTQCRIISTLVYVLKSIEKNVRSIHALNTYKQFVHVCTIICIGVMGAVVLPLILLNFKLYRLLRSTAYCQMSNTFCVGYTLYNRQSDPHSDSQNVFETKFWPVLLSSIVVAFILSIFAIIDQNLIKLSRF